MAVFSTVRFRVKPGRDQEFLDAHKTVAGEWPGLIRADIIKTGDRSGGRGVTDPAAGPVVLALK